MSLRLLAFEYRPRGIEGWTSGKLAFGKLLTAVTGDNGSGKTPIMKGIAFALGHTVAFPPIIEERCSAVALTVDIDGVEHEIVRAMPPADFGVSVAAGSASQVFDGEGAFSNWLLEKLGIVQRKLTARQGAQTQIYSSALVPAFWVDQDRGWRSVYEALPSKDFVRDQGEEMLRAMIGLPARHPFSRREEIAGVSKELSGLERQLEIKRRSVERLRTEVELDGGRLQSLVQKREQIARLLEHNKDTVDSIRGVSRQYEQRLDQIVESMDSVEAEIRSVVERQQYLDHAIAEVTAEVRIHSANVHAAELLRTICTNAECGLFGTKRQSFGRALLFLQDQLKDLSASDGRMEAEIQRLQRARTELVDELERTRAAREGAIEQSDHGAAVANIKNLTRELVEVELRAARHDVLTRERQGLENLVVRIADVEAHLKELRRNARGGGVDMALADVRLALGKKLREWLAVLKTQNIAAEVSIDAALVPHVGTRPFNASSHESGSTRTRFILAYHAALMELALERGHHPGVLLFDAPKQHELDGDDFGAYVDRLRALGASVGRPVQIVFSVKELQLSVGPGDVEWKPLFAQEGGEGRRFLGRTEPASLGNAQPRAPEVRPTE